MKSRNSSFYCGIMKRLTLGGVPMISNQETLLLIPLMAIYDIVVPKDNQLGQINDFVDFSFM